MDKETAQLRELLSLTEHPGWSVLVKQLNDEVEELKEAVLHVPDWDSVVRIRGRIEQSLLVANLEALVLYQLEALEQEEDSVAEDV